ncbi:MAG TPA: SDR family NAD(P)-dependent oxidoreductase [Polyangiales bacterium]|nr:SDR family NAD(P)-dependent oxidoreductase [Polyangiales bacterium]
MRELNDRVAVVTGAGSGIGRAIALTLARAGMHVVVADIDPARIEQVVGEVQALGRRALGVRTDVRQESAFEQLLAETLATFGTCHVMVNNAGVFHANTLLGAPTEQWQRVIDTNLWGVIHGCRVFGRHFVSQRSGHIVNTASAAGLFPMVAMSAYSTSKYAIVGFSQQLRWELAADGVGVTLLCPGVVKTGIGSAAGMAPEDVHAMTARSPGPEGLARKVLRAIKGNKPLVRYGGDSYAFSLLRLLPQWMIEPLGKFMARTASKFLRGELKLK